MFNVLLFYCLYFFGMDLRQHKKGKNKKKEKNDIQDGCKYNEHDLKKRGVRYIKYILGCIVI